MSNNKNNYRPGDPNMMMDLPGHPVAAETPFPEYDAGDIDALAEFEAEFDPELYEAEILAEKARENNAGSGCADAEPTGRAVLKNDTESGVKNTVGTDITIAPESAKFSVKTPVLGDLEDGAGQGENDAKNVVNGALGGDGNIGADRLGGLESAATEDGNADRLGGLESAATDGNTGADRLGGLESAATEDDADREDSSANPIDVGGDAPAFVVAMRAGNLDKLLNPVNFCEFLNWLGYRQLKARGPFQIVIARGWVVERVDILQCKRDVEALVNAADVIQSVKDRVFRKTKEFFKEINLTSLREFEGEFLRDGEDVCYKLYRNCLAKVTAAGIEPVSYKKLDRYVWKEDMIPRALVWDRDWMEGSYCRFTQNQCSDPRKLDANGQPTFDPPRWRAYVCSLGYNLHDFKTKMQPSLTIYSDSVEGDRERNGGTGKSMVIQFLQAMQAPGAAARDRLVVETGDRLRADYNFNFDTVTRLTRVVVIDDLNPKRFGLEDLYSAVTVGITINRKGQQTEFIEYLAAPKFVVTSNDPVSGTRDSDLRRRMDVQLYPFYNAVRKPRDDFGCEFFGTGFSTLEWRRFDCFALYCVALSLKHKVAVDNLPAYANNVLEVSLELEIGDDLVEFLDLQVLPLMQSAGSAKLDAKGLKTGFEEAYSIRRKESSKRFNSRLRRYGQLRKMEVEVRAGSSVYWCTFTMKGTNREV